MAMERKYVYGIVLADQCSTFETPGIGGSVAYTIVQDGVACVVSDYRGREFSALSKEELVRCLLVHQAVVEKAMERYAVLPVKFGTVLSGEDEVHAFISRGRRRLVSSLAQIQDKVEMEVAATWDTAKVLRELAGQDEIVRARTAVTSASPGGAFEDKVRLGQIVKEALEERRRVYRERMLALLAPVALDLHSNILVSDQMVMNVAFLLLKDRQGEFDDRVTRLNDSFEDRIDFRIIGPLPPYSFATVEVTRLDLWEIEAARRLLGIEEPLSENRVRMAYRRLAADNHPDLCVDKALVRQDLTQLREASEVLLSYCQAKIESHGPQRNHNNAVESIAPALLVNVRRLPGEGLNPSCSPTAGSSWSS